MPDLFGVLRRRWYVLLAGILLTAAVGQLAIHPPDRYQASEVLLIKPPISQTAPNAVTGLHPSEAITAAALADRLETPDERAQFAALGVTGAYTFAPRNTGTNQEPRYVIGSMAITYVTGDEAESLHSLQILSDAFLNDLQDLQDQYNVRKDLRITASMLVPPTTALLPHSAIRSLAGVGLVGALLTAALMLWIDEAVRRRKRATHPEPRRFEQMDGELVRSGQKL
ncbi:MAG TPA: hypothetical protein VGD29_10085 [Actinoplanes sp.]